MRRNVLRSSILGLALLASASVSADSLSLGGVVSGIELCEQAVCGSAIVAGAFAGQIADRPAFGPAVGSIVHQTPLPTVVGQCIDLLGRSWSIRTLRRTVTGDVAGGNLCYAGNLRYGVQMAMDIDEGGTATFTATLDHGPFPPTIRGVITQP